VEGDASVAIATPLIGDFNVANLLCVVASCARCGVSLADAGAPARRCARCPAACSASTAARRGRAADVVVDYAHTPDALEKALRALAPLARQRGGTLWCVFGCGGNRDPASGR
jgi:UDP-N-acetylmuramoyl-L-alanyl-D-glutamate--2,6-diaminopimelate ligase